jgi:ribosome recycling factor
VPPDALSRARSRFRATLDHTTSRLAALAGERLAPGVLDGVTVDVYGQRMPLRSAAQVGVEGRALVVTAFDAAQHAAIRKALEQSSLGLAVRDDGRAIRLSSPPPSADRRAEVARELARVAEAGRQALRGTRADAERALRAAEKAGELNPRHANGRVKQLRSDFESARDELEAELERRKASVLGEAQ